MSEPLEVEIRAFESRCADLQKNYPSKFVVFHGDKMAGAWDTMDAAAENAIREFDRGPYLIRQVGAPMPSLPASVLFKTVAPA